MHRQQQTGHMIAIDPIRASTPPLQAGGRPHMGPGSARRCAALGRDDNREVASQIDRDVQ